jgi:hypothetical protein
MRKPKARVNYAPSIYFIINIKNNKERQLTHVHGAREGLALGEDGETVGQCCNVVFGSYVLCFDGLVTLNGELLFDAFDLPYARVAWLDRTWQLSKRACPCQEC